MSDPQPRRLSVGALAFIATVIFGFGIAFVAVLISQEQGGGTDSGAALTADQREGRELFADRCANCHVLEDASAVGRVGPDLDELKPSAGLVADAIVKGRMRGSGTMPAQLVEGGDVQKVADYVATVAGRAPE